MLNRTSALRSARGNALKVVLVCVLILAGGAALGLLLIGWMTSQGGGSSSESSESQKEMLPAGEDVAAGPRFEPSADEPVDEDVWLLLLEALEIHEVLVEDAKGEVFPDGEKASVVYDFVVNGGREAAASQSVDEFNDPLRSYEAALRVLESIDNSGLDAVLDLIVSAEPGATSRVFEDDEFKAEMRNNGKARQLARMLWARMAVAIREGEETLYVLHAERVISVADAIGVSPFGGVQTGLALKLGTLDLVLPLALRRELSGPACAKLYDVFDRRVTNDEFFSVQNKTNSSATKVILAIRAFESEQGRLPKSLDELVPEFGEQILVDPSVVDRPFQYTLLDEPDENGLRFRLVSTGTERVYTELD